MYLRRLLTYHQLSLTYVTILFLVAGLPTGFAQDPTEKPLTQTDFKEIRVEKADIANFIRIFSKETKRNYILDEKVHGTITGYFPGGLTRESQERILDSILALKGFTTVPIADNLWKVIPSKDARKSTVPFRDPNAEDPLTGSVVSSLLPLKHVAANDIQNLVNQMISPDGLVQAYNASNALLIVDYDLNIERIRELVSALDIPYADREMTIIPVEYADANDLASKLQMVLEQDSGDSGGPNRLIQQRVAGNVNRNVTPGTENQQRREPQVIADERTNSIIVVADLETTARIRALVAQLDSEVDRAGIRFFVYRCQHAKATALTEVLSGLVGNNGGGNVNTPRGLPQGSNLTNATRSDQRIASSQGRLDRQRRTPGTARAPSTTPAGVGSVQFDENTSITADPDTNSLIINSTQEGYYKIANLLRELDIKRRQVLVEAVILEVTIDESNAMGTDWLTSTGGADGGVLAQSNFGGGNGLQGLISNPAGLTNFTLAAASAGTLTLPGDIVIPSQTVIMNAVQNNSKVNILSSPTLLATDNEQAEIVVGQNVPFLASTSTNPTNLNNTFNQIDRQDVGITLRITPSISSNDFVNLNIFTDVSAVIPSADSDLGPTTTVRSSETTVIVKDSQMIAIGGLISDTNSDSTSGIPFFRDIPIFGDLFGRATESRIRTNLLTFITPHIIRDQFDARDRTVDHRDTFKEDLRKNKIPPSRQDVLEDPHINNVAELSNSELPIPEPLIPPDTSEDLTSLPDEEPLEIEVNSKLPRPANSRFLLLKVQADQEIAGHLPFKLNQEKVFIIDASNSPAASFFQVGKYFNYAVGSQRATIQVLGSFDSAAQAIKFHGHDAATYTPSPYELLNLGKGPWMQSQ
jgi:general secretion pathway protein D